MDRGRCAIAALRPPRRRRRRRHRRPPLVVADNHDQRHRRLGRGVLLIVLLSVGYSYKASMWCFNNSSRVSVETYKPVLTPAAKAKASLLWMCGPAQGRRGVSGQQRATGARGVRSGKRRAAGVPQHLWVPERRYILSRAARAGLMWTIAMSQSTFPR